MEYIIKNNLTGRKFYVMASIFETSLDRVWMSHKYWFSTGCSVTITDENGNCKTFTR